MNFVVACMDEREYGYRYKKYKLHLKRVWIVKA